MRFLAVLMLATVSARLLLTPAFAAGADDLYLDAYRLIQEGDQFLGGNQTELARERYAGAEATLKKLQSSYPEYNKNAVEFRLDYIHEKTKTLPAVKPGGSQPVSPQKSVRPAPVESREDVIKQLNAHLAQLEADNAMLQGKLKEALAPQPAALDPHEFARAQEKINQLEKEKALLRASLQQVQAKQPQAVDAAMLDQSRGELEATKKQLVENVASVASLTQENQRLQREIAARASVPTVDPAVLNQTRSELDAAKKQLAESASSTAALNQENQRLQQQLSARAEQANSAKDLQAKLSSLEQERTDWQKQRADLETKLAAAPKSSSDSARVKDIEKERDAVSKKLSDANKELYDLKARGQSADRSTLTNQLANLRARLEVFEARKVPFTKEELALMEKNVSKLATTAEAKPAKRSVRELPAGAAIIVADAERAFAAKRFQDAEDRYKEVLKMDEENAVSLANLAAIQIELQKFDEAETNLKKAISIHPDDSYAMSLMGMMRFQQGKYEEALDNLSHSAQLDPKNPETQNYLGITLSQQGQREGAETALRKAVTLNPNYAGAHHNLAVIYATQRPPFLELAKYHYNKALSLGQPSNPDLEKQLGGAK